MARRLQEAKVQAIDSVERAGIDELINVREKLGEVHDKKFIETLFIENFTEFTKSDSPLQEMGEEQKAWMHFLQGDFRNYPDYDKRVEYSTTKGMREKRPDRGKNDTKNDLAEIVERYCFLTLYCAQRLALKEGKVQLAFNYAGGLHHARSDMGFGFCPANDIALAIKHWKGTDPSAKILYVDIDFHHGDGVEQIFYDDQDVVTFSTHGSFGFPQTGCYADRFGNPTALSRPFWYDPTNGHLGDKGLRETAKTQIEALRETWLEDVKKELSGLFQQHEFAHVILQSGVDSIIGGDGGGKLNLFIRPFLTVENHLDLALHVTGLARDSGSKLLVLGGGGYEIQKAADQWYDEMLAITAIFQEASAEAKGAPGPAEPHKDLTEKWTENASHALLKVRENIINQEWFPQDGTLESQKEDYSKLTDTQKESHKALLEEIRKKEFKNEEGQTIRVWGQIDYLPLEIQANLDAFLSKIPAITEAGEVKRYAEANFEKVIPLGSTGIVGAYRDNIIAHAVREIGGWADQVFNKRKNVGA